MNTHNQSKTMEERTKEIVKGVIARTCSLFGGSLADLQPEDQEIEDRAIADVQSLFTSELTSLRSRVEKEAVLKYILSLGWQDTDNEYVKEVLKDADDIAKELDQMIERSGK